MNVFRKLARNLMMLDPGYRKAFFLEQKLEARCDELMKAISNSEKSCRETMTAAASQSQAALVAAIGQSQSALNSAIDQCRTETISAVEFSSQDIKAALDAVKTALFRNDIKCRWQVLDALDGLLFPPSTPVKCIICGHEAPKSSYETKVSECIFGGGRLERFVCPQCGCIFGPLKMMALSQEQLGEEYKQNYSVYSESDTMFLEKPTFEALSPVKDGVYLNYGAGAWNKTTVELRDAGWQVFDYEPYAPAESREWVIRSPEKLATMKFDGIFSNDVVEHFRDPVAAFEEMKSILKPNAKMAHTTGCYDYEYPYTRFHFTFFTGKSLDVLSKRLGMKYELRGRIDERFPSRLSLFEFV